MLSLLTISRRFALSCVASSAAGLLVPAWCAEAQQAPNLPAVPELNPVSRFNGVVDLPGGMELEFSVVLVPAVGNQPTGGTMSIPMQGLKDGALEEVEIGKDWVKFTLKSPGAGANEAAWARFEAAPVAGEEKTWRGTLKQNGQVLPLTLVKTLAGDDKPAKPRRPQTPVPPFPYDERPVSFVVQPGGHVMAGTLSLPRGEGRRGAVVMVTGSGPQDRDETLFAHKPFAVIADALTRAGIAVLRYDDRGVNGSAMPRGQRLQDATTLHFADDAQAAVEFLAKREEIDAGRIGIIGHSEGALIASIVASRSKDVAFVVLLAGPGVPGREILTTQSVAIARASGAGAEALAKIEVTHRVLMDILSDPASKEDAILPAIRALTEAQLVGLGQEPKISDAELRQVMLPLDSRWLREFLVLDPAVYLRQVRVPVLALNGSLDTQVPAEQNLAAVAAALEQAGNKDVTTAALPGLNHLFQTSMTGSPTEYALIEETFAPAALEKVVEWVRQRAGEPAK
jgi:fermentation-respiration switch protein FrsA (DUF1100 family)